MILIDPRSGADPAGKPTTVDEMVRIIRKLGVPCEKGSLEFGDVAFEGNTDRGVGLIGVERKTLHDFLKCINDARYAGHQRPGMEQTYGRFSFLNLEGCWRPHDPDGFLMEGFDGGTRWGFCKPGGQRVMYNKLYRYLLSVSMSGVTVIYSRDLYGTCFNICEMYHWFQKPWDSHISMQETHRVVLPSLTGKVSLVRQWASCITDIGVKLSIEAEKLFKTPKNLANSTESDWMKLRGIAAPSAMKIVREILGVK